MRSALGATIGLSVLLALGPVAVGQAGAAGSKSSARIVAEIKTLLHGIPQRGERLGNPSAPVTLQWFGDLECPSCAYFTLHTLPTLIKEFVRPGELQVEYHSFKSYTREQSVFEDQQIAALAAGRQSQMWDYIELFYHEQTSLDQGGVDESALLDVAQQVPGLNMKAWIAARGEAELAAAVEHDGETGATYGWETTPDFLLGSDGELVPFTPAGPEAQSFAAAIGAALRGATPGLP